MGLWLKLSGVAVGVALAVQADARIGGPGQRGAGGDVARQPELVSAKLHRALSRPGEVVELEVSTLGPARRAYAECAALGWNPMRLGAHTDGKQRSFGTLVALPNDARTGMHRVRVTVEDLEGRTLHDEVSLAVRQTQL